MFALNYSRTLCLFTLLSAHLVGAEGEVKRLESILEMGKENVGGEVSEVFQVEWKNRPCITCDSEVQAKPGLKFIYFIFPLPSLEWCVNTKGRRKEGKRREMKNWEKQEGWKKRRQTDRWVLSWKKKTTLEKMQLIPFRAFTLNFPPTQPANDRAKGWGESGLTSWLCLNNLCSSSGDWELCGEAGALSFPVLWVNYSFNFSLQQRIWTCSKIHQLPMYMLQLLQLGILIGSDTHMCFVSGCSCRFMYLCRFGVRVRVHVLQSTWLGLWQTLSRWRSISIRGQLYSSTPAAHYSPQQQSAARAGQVHTCPCPPL